MNPQSIQKFYYINAEKKKMLNYDIFQDELNESFISRRDSAEIKQSKIQTKQTGNDTLKQTPICYFLLSSLCFLIALRHLPSEDKIYFFYDDPVSSNLSLIICMSLLCLFGVIIAQVLKLSYSQKDIPFLQITRQNKYTFNQLITYLGQFAHLLLLAEVIFQIVPSPIMKFEHEVLLDLSMILTIVYLGYTTHFLHKANEKSYLRIILYIAYMLLSGLCKQYFNNRVLTQNFLDQFKLHYTYTFKNEAIHIILPYLALFIQGCYSLMYYPILKNIEISITRKKQQNLEVL